MFFKPKALSVRNNQALANTFTSRGKLDKISGYLCPSGQPASFLISGISDNMEQYFPLYDLIPWIAEQMPVVILHNGDPVVESIAGEAAVVIDSYRAAQGIESTHSALWCCNQGNREFEPLLGMNTLQLTSVLRRLALKLGYSPSPQFERVIQGHVDLLTAMEMPISLSGLYYFCQFDNMGVFHDEVMQLKCGQDQARRIWSDMDPDDTRGSGQFDLFRAVIRNLARDAMASGWNSDGDISSFNCLQAIREHAVFTLSIQNSCSALLLPYLTEELKDAGNTRFFLLLDNININDPEILDFLCSQSSNCILGVLAQNAVEMVGNQDNDFLRLAERFNCLVLFKHNTGTTATVLSRALGEYEHVKTDVTSGSSREWLRFLPQTTHEEVHTAVEQRFRIMPEEIQNLGPRQAIIFDASTNQIIRYN